MKGEICIVVPFSIKIMIRLTGKLDYTSRSYTYLIWEFAAAYAPMRTIETYRQTKPLLTKRRKAARELNPYRQKLLIMQTGHPYSSGIYEVLRMERKLTKPKS